VWNLVELLGKHEGSLASLGGSFRQQRNRYGALRSFRALRSPEKQWELRGALEHLGILDSSCASGKSGWRYTKASKISRISQGLPWVFLKTS